MEKPRFAFTTNGHFSGELKPAAIPIEEIRRRAELLDGVERFSLSLWAQPTTVAFDKIDLSKWPFEYIQAAGSRDRLLVELRKVEGGIARQFAIGRRSVEPSQSAKEEIVAWNGCLSKVMQNEILDSQDCVQLFLGYISSEMDLEMYSLRLLTIS